MPIGIIGLGLLGRAMAARLAASGHTVCGFDINPAASGQAAAAGVEVMASATEVAEQAPIIFLSLMTSGDRHRLLWTEQRIAEHLPEGRLILDTTTAEPASIRVDHDRLAGQGVRIVDVCIVGSSQSVSEQRALALVGDTADGASPYRTLLETFTKHQYYFDQPGRGNEAKLVVNTVLGLQRLVLAEGMALARAGGFDLTNMLEVLQQGDSYCMVMDTKGPRMASRTYEPAVARLEQHAKDVELILAYAEGLGLDLPVSRLHRELMLRAISRGAGALDNAAIFEAYP